MTVPSVARPETWTRGRRKSDGRAFWFIPGTTPGAVYCADSTACTCPSARHSQDGTCKHTRAVLDFEQQADAAQRRAYEAMYPSPKPRVSYETLFPKCRTCHDVADGRDGYCYACSSDRERQARRAQ